MRGVFIMLLMNLPTSPWALFVAHMEYMISDFAHRDGVAEQELDLAGNDAGAMPAEQRSPIAPQSKYNRLLLDLDERLQRMGRENIDFGLPEPLAPEHARAATQLEKHLALYCNDASRAHYRQLLQERIPTFSEEQRALFFELYVRMRDYCNDERNAAAQQLGDWGPQWDLQVPAQYVQLPPGRSKVFFLDARGGCGKTYVLNALLAAARMHKVVGLAGCFTGIAADDYEGGVTLHRLFKLPVVDSFTDNVQSTCNKESQHAELLTMCGLFIIDEVMTAGVKNAQAIEELLSDLVCARGGDEPEPKQWFGGRLCTFSGDFSQTAPVTIGADRVQGLAAWISNAPFWKCAHLPSHASAVSLHPTPKNYAADTRCRV